MVRHIFVGIDLGDKNSVARIAIDREKAERLGFVNDRRGRARLFEQVKRQAEAAGATIAMAYEASSCGFILCDEAEAKGIACGVLAPTKMALVNKVVFSGRVTEYLQSELGTSRSVEAIRK